MFPHSGSSAEVHVVFRPCHNYSNFKKSDARHGAVRILRLVSMATLSLTKACRTRNYNFKVGNVLRATTWTMGQRYHLTTTASFRRYLAIDGAIEMHNSESEG